MSFYDEEDFENRTEVELDEDEKTGLVMVPGQLVFSDLYQPSNGGNDDYDLRYGVTFRLPKGNEFAAKLFAVCEAVAEKTWKKEAEEKLEAIWDCVDKGVSPKTSHINIQDGDLHNPEYNRGSWQVKASRREDEGAPEVLLPDTTALDFDPDSKTSVDAAKKAGPNKGDFCYFLIRVWGQKKRERLNFSLEGIQLVERGTLRAKKADRKQIVSKFGKVKGLPSGFAQKAIASGQDDDVEDAEVIEEEEAKPSRAKVAPKAKPGTKKGLFRGKKK